MPARKTEPLLDIGRSLAADSSVRRHVVLLGGGHSHVAVLRSFAMRPEPRTRLTLISPYPHAVYSGMVPGTLVGLYPPEASRIDVSALAARSGATYLPDRATRIDAARRVVETETRGEIPYDLLSVDVGSRPLGIDGVRDLPAVVGAKPVEEATGRIARFLERARESGHGNAVVVGAGSGGVEVAFALCRELGRDRVGLVEAAPELLPGGSARMRRLVARLVAQYGIASYVGRRFETSEGGRVTLDDGTTLEAELVVWATGAEGLPFLRRSGLPVDERGFVRVDDQLRCVAAPEIFAVGDCARMESHPELPRAGVYAVRQGPILDENLRRSLRDRPLLRYRPQSDFLSLVSTGDGRAAMSYRGLASHGRLWWRLKDWIDRRFIESYEPPRAARLRRGPEVAATMPMDPCGGCAAKIDPDMLARTLRGLGAATPSVTIGLDAPDDAAVLPAPEGNLVFTVDAFPPFASDPRLAGEVAALNALSDVWAMGGTPTAVLALVGVDPDDGESREADLRQMMQGARLALDRVGVPLAGGHSIELASPLIGFAVVGSVSPDGTLTKGGARAGDHLYLTKPLGTGVVLAATRAGACPVAWTEEVVRVMREPNDAAARCCAAAQVHACTDVSGFGLVGHLAEMLRASGASAEVGLAGLPSLPGALELLEAEWRSSADESLRDALSRGVELVGVSPDAPGVALAFDPQTSGGLLAAVSPDDADGLERRFADAGVGATRIGTVCEGSPGAIRLLARAAAGGQVEARA